MTNASPSQIDDQDERGPLEGWVPVLGTDAEVRDALEKAFDYRGDITLDLKDGSRVEGYLYDRRADGPALSDCVVRILPKDGSARRNVRYSDIARLAFTGKDTAAGKSFETWVRKYQERHAKQAGATETAKG